MRRILTRIRTFYLLHQTIVDLTNGAAAQDPEKSADSASSYSALDSAVDMMTEVASDHLQKITNIDRLPVCAGYNFELCIRHLEARQSPASDDSLQGLKDLRHLVDEFRHRWPLQESHSVI